MRRCRHSVLLSSPGGPALLSRSIPLLPATQPSLLPQSGGCSTFNSAGARMCQASVTNSRSRVMSMRSSPTITSGDQS